eukprot:160707_1
MSPKVVANDNLRASPSLSSSLGDEYTMPRLVSNGRSASVSGPPAVRYKKTPGISTNLYDEPRSSTSSEETTKPQSRIITALSVSLSRSRSSSSSSRFLVFRNSRSTKNGAKSVASLEPDYVPNRSATASSTDSIEPSSFPSFTSVPSIPEEAVVMAAKVNLSHELLVTLKAQTAEKPKRSSPREVQRTRSASKSATSHKSSSRRRTRKGKSGEAKSAASSTQSTKKKHVNRALQYTIEANEACLKKIIAGEKKQKTKVTKYRIAVVKHEIEKQMVLNKAVAKHLCRGEDLHLAIVVSHLMEIQASYGEKQQKLDKKRG